MAAGRFDFTLEQGSTIQFDIQYVDNRNKPLDLTGYDGRMQIRPSVESTSSYLTLSSSLDGLGSSGLNFSGSNGTTSPTSGSIGLFIAATQSAALDWDGKAVYDLEIYSGSGDTQFVRRLLEGNIKLSKEVTTTP
jgi:hypothetical protein